MTFFNTLKFEEQGIYDAIERLGSLVARIILAPLEECAYVYFSHNINRDLSAAEQKPENMKVHRRLSSVQGIGPLQTATQMLHGLLRATAILGGLVCVFGTAYSYMALRLYGGEQLATPVGQLHVFFTSLSSLLLCRSSATARVQLLHTATGAERHLRVLYVCYV